MKGWLSIIFGVGLAAVALAAFTQSPSARGAASRFFGVQILPAKAEVPAGVDLALVATGFREITDIQFVPGSSNQAVVLQKGGKASLTRLGAPRDGVAPAERASRVLSVAVATASELGLLGLAFHPKFEDNGLFYLNYNPAGGAHRTRIAEWQVAPQKLGQEPAREKRVLLEVEQPYNNHNGGQLAFGPDGYLYIALGDGGSGGDPLGHGQNLQSLLGKILRIDVDGRDAGLPYAVPKDNPFVGKPARAEIWAYGLRNPWRFSFLPDGRVITADVGQNLWEEVDVVQKGDNLGWNVREGAHCFKPRQDCAARGLVDPIFEYPRELGQSITGGFVYTGRSVPKLAGRYVFGDFVTGRVWALTPPAKVGKTQAELLGRFPRAISTFGRDASGELYVGDFVSGDILRFVAK